MSAIEVPLHAIKRALGAIGGQLETIGKGVEYASVIAGVPLFILILPFLVSSTPSRNAILADLLSYPSTSSIAIPTMYSSTRCHSIRVRVSQSLRSFLWLGYLGMAPCRIGC